MSNVITHYSPSKVELKRAKQRHRNWAKHEGERIVRKRAADRAKVMEAVAEMDRETAVRVAKRRAEPTPPKRRPRKTRGKQDAAKPES